MNLGRSIPIVAQCIIDENIRIKYGTPFGKADETKGVELSKKNRITPKLHCEEYVTFVPNEI